MGVASCLPLQEQHVRPGISARPLITQLFVMSSRPVQLLEDLAQWRSLEVIPSDFTFHTFCLTLEADAMLGDFRLEQNDELDDETQEFD